MRIADCGLRIAFLIVTVAALARADVSDRISRVLSISPGATISVQITVGEVAVHAWDRDQVSVELERRAPDARRLEHIPAHVEQSASGVTVRAIQPDGSRDASLRTDVVLRVPVAAQVRDISVFEGGVELTGLHGACSARIERGDIVGKRLGGAIRLETAIGDVRLEGATLSPDGLIRLRTFNGNVALELARVPTDARILALSMGGTVSSQVPLNLKQKWGPRFGEATLGNGEPVISIDAVNGNITITVAGGAR